METVKHSLETVKKLIGRKVRTKLDVDLWGTIYNRKKVGTISTISISKHGVRALVLFKWKAMKSYQQQEL
ncbi:MAG TPA: hypothetical protein VJ583_05825, partial [Nitrososphaeraceae archaeon]|nr:hypothetical protein [Nitrososphaeraceae archaeon]